MVPARAELRASRERWRQLSQRDAGRHVAPTLLQQRNAAGRKYRRPDYVDGVRLSAISRARRRDGQEVVIHHGKEVARSEAIRGIQDVGLAPADELPAQYHRQLLPVICGVELPHLKRRTPALAIGPRKLPRPIHLLVRVRARIDATRKLPV